MFCTVIRSIEILLRLTLLIMYVYINDLDSGAMNWILKIADDTKIFGRVLDDQDRSKLQMDLDKLVQWSVEWQMQFNVRKCVVMHLGKSNKSRQYTMLDVVDVVKDLGVWISKDFKVSNQCG